MGPKSGEHRTPEVALEARVIRLEEWRNRIEDDLERQDARGMDFETRLRVLEAAHMKMSGRIAVLAVVGSAAATAVVQVVVRAWGG